VVIAALADGGVALAADASVNPSSAAPGDEVTVSGDCGPAEPGDNVIAVFRQGSSVFGAIASEDLPSSGLFDLQVTIPHEVNDIPIEPGAASFEIICDVLPPPANPVLPFTVLAGLGEEPPPTTTIPPPGPAPTTAAPAPSPAPRPVRAAPRFTG
jgi:hypothetical protein